MIDWAQGGHTGSLRRWVSNEVKRHLKENATLSAARYPISLRFLRYIIAGRTFAWFLALYFAIDLALVEIDVMQALVAPNALERLRSSNTNFLTFLKDATVFFIAAQVGALGIISISVGLVTLIAQRQESSTDVQIYYHESLAQEVVASSIALLAILCVEVFWPAQWMTRFLDLGIPSSNFEAVLMMVHTFWLIINLWALAHFVALSLSFVQPGQRETIREAYTANWVVQNDLKRRLERQLYLTAGQNLLEEANTTDGPTFIFGFDPDGNEVAEVTVNFKKPVVLHDVRMRLLQWALRRWWRRCEDAMNLGEIERPRGLRFGGPRILFTPYFDRKFEGRTGWCRRYGGTSLAAIERFAIRHSFTFRRAQR
jgi:hypothetical protein